MSSVALVLLPLDWRGIYTRRHTYCSDTSKPGGDAVYRTAYSANRLTEAPARANA